MKLIGCSRAGVIGMTLGRAVKRWLGWPLLWFLWTSLPLQVKKPRKKRSKGCSKLVNWGPCLYGVLATARAMPRLCSDIQAADFPDRSAWATTSKGWAELVGMQQRAPAGNSVKCLSRYFRRALLQQIEISASSSPGAVLCGAEEPVQALVHCRHMFSCQTSEAAATKHTTGEGNGMRHCSSIPACPWSRKALCMEDIWSSLVGIM